MLKRFLKERDGNFAILTAIALPVLLGSVGLSVDVAHILNVRTHLQNAADGAVLAASREGANESERNQLFSQYLNTNIPRQGLAISDAHIEIESGANFLRVDGYATATVDLFFMQHLGVRQVSVVASTFRSVKSMEIAVVLDNTGSMGAAGITALKKASHALVDAVDAGRAPDQDVRISLVPFVTAVNIKGEGFDPAWVDMTGKSLYNGWNFIDNTLRQKRRNGERLTSLATGYGSNTVGDPNNEICGGKSNNATARAKRERCAAADKYPHHAYLFQQSGTTWKGCVEARPYPYNADLTAPDPTRPETLFVPYFAPDEPGNAQTDNGGDNASSYNNSWLNDEISGTEAIRQRSTLKYISPASKRIHEAGQRTIGPNRACPTPIVPLTADLSKIRNGINAMNFWNGSGTNIAEGLAWGWRVLSPGAPYDQAGDFNPTERAKYLILMTDGQNVSFGASGTMNKSDYGSYNFLGNGLIDGTTNQGTAETTLNNWTREMCTQMKQQQIEIFTVVYNTTNTAVQNLFRSCATRTENFYMTSNTAALETAFANIGRQMSRLRLTN